MKTNTTSHRPFHLHLEYFFRKQYCLIAMLALLIFAVIKTDGRIINLWREAYAQGFGLVGQYMREETTRVPITFDIAARIPTVSGR
ncbi:MAG TPA: hypothetical protein VJP80_03080 [Candidatus Saccharimonadales bacterium]|nr:hypothetical protein [Candidatus Saccharimonadales bacterium]